MGSIQLWERARKREKEGGREQVRGGGKKIEQEERRK